MCFNFLSLFFRLKMVFFPLSCSRRSFSEALETNSLLKLIEFLMLNSNLESNFVELFGILFMLRERIIWGVGGEI